MFSAMLDGHPELNWLPDEAFFLEHIYRLGKTGDLPLLVKASKSNIDYFLRGLENRWIMPDFSKPLVDFPDLAVPWSQEILLRELNALKSCENIADVWSVLVSAYVLAMGQKKRRFFCAKAADFGRSVFGALEHLPNSYGIVIVRNPTSTLNSIKRYREKGGYKLLTWPTLLETIREMNELASYIANLSAEMRNRVFVLRYEDIVSGKKQEMSKVAQFLNIPFSESLLIPSMLGREWTSNSSFIEHAGTQRPPSERPFILSEDEVSIIDQGLEQFRTVFSY